MIFSVSGHIKMIRDGVKTQTRRPNRGLYKVGRAYAVQKRRGVKAEKDIRICIDRIWPETPIISHRDAREEGGYEAVEYELEFEQTYPKWDKVRRWGFEFHVIKVVE